MRPTPPAASTRSVPMDAMLDVYFSESPARAVEIRATDGQRLAASVFQPTRPRAGAPAVVVNSATGVRRDYYAPFARFLAERGYTVVTYDYRGIGGSRP